MADDISIGQFTDLMEMMWAGVESIARAGETGSAHGHRIFGGQSRRGGRQRQKCGHSDPIRR